MSQEVLSISDLSFGYGTASQTPPVISNLSLSVKRGELVCILGASGCGKTTLLNLIAGLATASGGSITIGGKQDLSDGQIGYIFQQDALLPWRTVKGNLNLAREINQNLNTPDYDEKIATYLNVFHLEKKVLDQYPAQLSGGMRQRVAIIQALMLNPDLLLLDEPFAALDFYTKLRLESEFRQLVKTHGKGAVLVTHDIDEAIAMGDRILIMRKGGVFIKEYEVDLGKSVSSPEEARGAPQFATYYHKIWNDLKAVIAE